VEIAEPPVNFLLINAEAIVDMDINAVEMLDDLHNFLKKTILSRESAMSNVIFGKC
jgi:hypothetical protein